jgi:alpha-ribazole phosphatase
MKSYIVHLIRHGITSANLNGEYAGAKDVPLCNLGREKLQELKSKYKYPKVDAYYSSPLSRCKETCKIIYPEVEPIIVDGLKECDFGDWEGKTAKELGNNEEFRTWLKSRQQISPPNGESGEEFGKRIRKSFENVIEDLLRKGITSAAIFAHGGVIMSLLSIYEFSKKDFYNWIVSNGCGYSLRITPSLWMRDKVFEILGEVPPGHDQGIIRGFKYLMDQTKSLSE